MIDRKKLIDLIPWYINGTLRGEELEEVEDFITNDPQGKAALAEWNQIRQLLRTSIDKDPPSSVENKLFTRIQAQSFEQMGIFHPFALGLSIIILVLLWTIIRPGITLHWSATSSRVTTFRIYRSEADGSKYQLLDELPANSLTAEYTYIDLFFWPFNQYIYYVEVMDQSDSISISQVVASPSTIALPGQLALIGGSFIAGYGIILLIRYRRFLLIGNMRLYAI